MGFKKMNPWNLWENSIKTEPCLFHVPPGPILSCCPSPAPAAPATPNSAGTPARARGATPEHLAPTCLGCRARRRAARGSSRRRRAPLSDRRESARRSRMLELLKASVSPVACRHNRCAGAQVASRECDRTQKIAEMGQKHCRAFSLRPACDRHSVQVPLQRSCCRCFC